MSGLLAKDVRGINQLSPTWRIKRKVWHPPALWGACFCLQKKIALGLYRTVFWIHAECFPVEDSVDVIDNYFKWKMDGN